MSVAEVDLQSVIGDVIGSLGEQIKHRVEVTADTDIARDLNLDSLAIMDLLMALEDKFDVSIPLNNLAEIRTVRDLAGAIVDLKKAS